MSSEKKEKEPTPPFETVFAALEERAEGLAGRLKDLVAENARLKVALVETAAERERLKKELQDAREAIAQQDEATSKLERLEAERDDVRARIERLIKSLEEAESAGKAAS